LNFSLKAAIFLPLFLFQFLFVGEFMAMEQKEITDPYVKYNEQTSFLSKTIFASRWLQVP